MRRFAHSPRTKKIVADVVAFRDGDVVLLGEVKAMRQAGEIGVEILRDKITQIVDDGIAVGFGLFADHDAIRIFRVGEANQLVPCFEIASDAVFGHYDPEVLHRRIYDLYMATLLWSWLLDYAYARWERNPPGRTGFDASGLTEALHEAQVEFEWTFRLRSGSTSKRTS